ncbi:MAG TPA: L,D-transpeptidase family protein [Caulobacteraceae bacterium]|jgi:murein L,D-transpeptidase YcbB/YkuD|nr:L,D-transpeptidase family protein [Caulobacteraceae bacterium]
MVRKAHRSVRLLIGSGSLLALGCALSLGAAGLVQSQPAAPAAPAAPGTAATPPAAGVQPQAAQALPALRDDQVQLLVKTLADAESHGFRSSEFARPGLDALLASRDAAERQRGLVLLQRVMLDYAKAQHGLRLQGVDLPDEWSIKPAAYDAQADFNFALQQDKLAEWVASLPPPFERYRILRTALGQYRAIAAKGGWEPIAAGPSLKPGMSDQRVVQLRRRLAAENPPGSIELTSPVYDPQLAAIVASAQARYGLDPDGVVGPGVLKALNAPVEARISQIAANMERWRWMPRAWPATRVEVNIAGARLNVYDQNRPVSEMKVVVGAPDKKTPMLRSEIHSVVLNPPWNVPSSIATKELLPKGEAYLARNNFIRVSDGAGGSRLQQRPGPGNSLGRIKFDFNNPFGVYLHDTNAKAVFERDTRSVSHGCVRVERPEELANLLLGTDPDWSAEQIGLALADTETVRKPLAQKIPVMLLYWTVFTGPSGEVNFRNDVYGWDDRLTNLLNRGGIAA